MNKKYAIYGNRHETTSMLHFNMDNIEYYDYPDDETFIGLSDAYKIVVLELNYQDTDSSDRRLEEFKNCDKVMVVSIEMTPKILQLIHKYDLPNFVFVVSGFINFDLKHARYVPALAWMSSTASIWTDVLPGLLSEKLTPFAEKKFHFDAMYGLKKRHRTHVATWILENDLASQIFQTPYFLPDAAGNHSYNLDDSSFWEDELVRLDPTVATDYHCSYQGITMLISQVMPFKIYQQSAFSLVCEGEFDNYCSFPTEKIVKPMLACRMFIVISGMHFLKNLKSLGFKTFDGIIDESYDNEPDDETRWNMALEQVRLICQQDQQIIFKSIVPIVLHNRDLIARLPVNQTRIALETLILEEELKTV